MKKLRYLLFFVTISVIAVITFQLYWIANTYKVNEDRFSKDITSALSEAVHNELASKADSIKKTGASSIVVTPHIKNDSIEDGVSLINFLNGKGGKIKPENVTIKITKDSLPLDMYPDSIAMISDSTFTVESADDFDMSNSSWQDIVMRVVSEMLDMEMDLESLDTLYSEALNNRGISTEYSMAMFKKGKMIAGDTLLTEQFNNADVSMGIGRIYSDKTEIKVIIEDKTVLLLTRMWLSIVTSLMLVIVVVVSLVYMLYTIYKQKKLSDMKNDFISNMTHEFKTPIATVSAAVEAMQNFGVLDNKEKTTKYLSVSKNELLRLNSMVEKVLDISAYEKDSIDLNIEKLRINQLLTDTVDRFRLQHNDNVLIKLNADCNADIFADRMHIQNLINNLLDNAVKYCNKKPEIDVRCNVDKGFVSLMVMDNGIGISKENQKYIFDKFYRVKSDKMHTIKGFGLGLSYVNHVVNKHNGTINVKSKPGVGTEFTIKIPVAYE
jgi:signal transduction histidine kinase